MQDQLSVEDIIEIEKFCSNEKMYDAVKKYLCSGLYSQGVVKAGYKHNPMINGALSLVSLATENPIPDEMLGQHIRGIWEGLNALEKGFKGLKTITSKKDESVESPYNEAV